MPTPTTTSKHEMLNIRVKTEERDLIDHAARICGKNRTEFILEAARFAAEEALLNRAIIHVSQEAYSAFLLQLDKAPQPNESLRKTMQTPAPWEKA